MESCEGRLHARRSPTPTADRSSASNVPSPHTSNKRRTLTSRPPKSGLALEFWMKRIPGLKKSSLVMLVIGVVAMALAQNALAAEGHGISADSMDRSVKPGDDFYQYANGDWIKRTEIPPDRGRIGVFTALSELSDKRTAGLIEETAKGGAPAGSGPRKIADLYNSYMDEATIESRGLAPLEPHLKAITAIHNKQELAHAL